MSDAFKDSRNIVHALENSYDHPCSAGVVTLVARCGRRVKHHDNDYYTRNRTTKAEVDCMACIAEESDNA